VLQSQIDLVQKDETNNAVPRSNRALGQEVAKADVGMKPDARPRQIVMHKVIVSTTQAIATPAFWRHEDFSGRFPSRNSSSEGLALPGNIRFLKEIRISFPNFFPESLALVRKNQ